MSGEQRSDVQQRIRTVLVATPLGRGGRGGIDRLMDSLREALNHGEARSWRVRFGTTRGQASIWASPVYLATFLCGLIGRALTRHIDLVHINLSSGGSARRKIVVGRLARIFGIPYVVHLHGSRFRSFFDTASAPLQADTRKLIGKARRVIVLGGVWRDFVAERVPEATSRIVVLPNASEAISRPERGDTSGPLCILFLGQLGARKGVPQLVEALRRIADLDGWRAVIAGDGDILETRKSVDAAGLSTRIEVPGWVGPEDARALLVASDILVLPSFDENLPMSVIEGMSAGLAVIATPVGAVEDIVRDGDTGLLIAPGDAPALASALRRVVSDAPLRLRLGAAAQVFHRRNLDLATYLDRLADIWSEAAS